MENLNSPSERIRFIAKQDFQTMKKLAEALGLAPSTLHSYLDGKDKNARSKPGSELLERFYKIGYSTDWILTGNGDMRAENFASAEFLSDITEPQLRKVEENEKYVRYDIIVPKSMGQMGQLLLKNAL